MRGECRPVDVAAFDKESTPERTVPRLQ